MGVNHGSFDVIDVCVVFQGPLEEACLLAELGNVGFVIVCEHLVAHDCICDLGQEGGERVREREGVRELVGEDEG